ncbi:hypothetical protein [Nitrobacter sp.]|uniref:hypothetical protein n=1 Tax=Nitrobacter sp. TaxID=29420 RepID=UPI003F649C6C
MSVSERSTKRRKRNARKDFAIAVAIVAGGMAMPGVFLMQLAQGQTRTEIAQQQTPPQISPVVPAGKQNGPAEAEPGGTRPTTPAPEPAQPDADARKAGAQPALPPAPAEKTAPPIREK